MKLKSPHRGFNTLIVSGLNLGVLLSPLDPGVVALRVRKRKLFIPRVGIERCQKIRNLQITCVMDEHMLESLEESPIKTIMNHELLSNK